VDEYIITIAPIILGSGIPLFKELHTNINLKLEHVKKYAQFAELRFSKK
jgi:dihydrofolate reductase